MPGGQVPHHTADQEEKSLKQWQFRAKEPDPQSVPTESWWKRIGIWVALLVLLGTAFFVSAFMLLRYQGDYQQVQQLGREMADAYHAQPTTAPQELSTQEAPSTASQADHGSLFLKEKPYPNNPYHIVQPQLRVLRQTNRDIVGWLSIEGLMEHPVVQRDHTYYLDHDASGAANLNGAIFMNSATRLQNRPNTILLYGHNMKTGAMFGALRNYENEAFYHANPFISFNSLYEEGEYVIFSVAHISVNPADRRYVDLNKLQSSTIAWRSEALNRLRLFSAYMNYVPVQPDDQLLLLVTCIGDGDDRRVVAARRFRDNEGRDYLSSLIRQ